MAMAGKSSTTLISVISISLILLCMSKDVFSIAEERHLRNEISDVPCAERPAPIWPEKHVIVQKVVPVEGSNAKPATTVTYYDYPAGANLIILTPDDPTKPVMWDLELNDGTSYYFYPSTRTCKRKQFPVGILRSDWLVSEAEPLGESTSWDGSSKRVCGWTKADFIDYYADMETIEPVSWYFHTMKAHFNVLYYKSGESAPDGFFEPPDYCQD